MLKCNRWEKLRSVLRIYLLIHTKYIIGQGLYQNWLIYSKQLKIQWVKIHSLKFIKCLLCTSGGVGARAFKFQSQEDIVSK